MLDEFLLEFVRCIIHRLTKLLLLQASVLMLEDQNDLNDFLIFGVNVVFLILFQCQMAYLKFALPISVYLLSVDCFFVRVFLCQTSSLGQEHIQLCYIIDFK